MQIFGNICRLEGLKRMIHTQILSQRYTEEKSRSLFIAAILVGLMKKTNERLVKSSTTAWWGIMVFVR